MSETRERAWALLAEYTKSQALRRHALAVEASMKALARSTGITDPGEIEKWGLVGLLHDFDYERFPTEEDHVWRGMEILRSQGWPEDIIRAIGGHAFYTKIDRVTPMEKAILAADELTGFIGACALVRPSKKVADLPVESVVKRLKEKSFARTVDRTYVTRGAEEWGTPLAELISLLIAAQIPIAESLGLGGVPAPDLADSPAPIEPPPA
ncbi:MAG: HDIG domain-containing protein [Acidobacteria bacterium]|nr:HDIG domain-containing protein [Acidobacteriota bacterium]